MKTRYKILIVGLRIGIPVLLVMGPSLSHRHLADLAVGIGIPVLLVMGPVALMIVFNLYTAYIFEITP